MNDDTPNPPDPAERPKGEFPSTKDQFKPGVSGNPKGRPIKTAGASVREWINNFAEQNLTEQQIREIARDPVEPWTRRTAALRILRTVESPDLADFAGLLRGENNLEDLRGMGIDTAVVKKFKQKTRKVPVGEGETEEVIEREIELHDRSGDDFDRVVNHTDGSPTQKVDVKHDGSLRTNADGVTAAASLLAQLKDRVGADAGRAAPDPDAV